MLPVAGHHHLGDLVTGKHAGNDTNVYLPLAGLALGVETLIVSLYLSESPILLLQIRIVLETYVYVLYLRELLRIVY